MVATLVRLRLLVLRNTLRRQTAQLVVVVIGAVYGAVLLVGVVIGLFLLDLAPTSVVRAVVVLGGALVLLGWTFLPLVATGIDETLEPARLAAYPIPMRSLLVGLFLAGVLGVPGAVTTLAALATAGSWLRLPGVAVVALLCGALGAATCVVASRAAAAIGVSVATGRRFREARGLLVLVPALLAGPILLAATTGLDHVHGGLGPVVDVVSWTPVGAVWAVPSEVALGHPAGAVARLLIAVATLVVLVALWRRGLAHALVTPAHTAERTRARGRLGLIGFVRRGPALAVAARSLSYWFRDPRYLRQLVILPVLPVLLVFYSQLDHIPGLLVALGPAVAFFLSLSIVADVSYDSTAFTLHLASGLSGAADRAGRAVAVLVFGLPATVVATVVSVAVIAPDAPLPAILGLALGMLGTGLGIGSVTSAVLVLPVPAPGDSLFRARPGANLSTALQMLLVWVVLAVLCAPEAVLLGITVATHQALTAWLTLLAGVVLGGVALTVGIRQGGRLLDRRGPELLAQLARTR